MLLWLVSIVISGYYYSTVTAVSLLSFVSRSFGYCLQQYKCIHCLSYPKLHFLTNFNLDPEGGIATYNVELSASLFFKLFLHPPQWAWSTLKLFDGACQVLFYLYPSEVGGLVSYAIVNNNYYGNNIVVCIAMPSILGSTVHL